MEGKEKRMPEAVPGSHWVCTDCLGVPFCLGKEEGKAGWCRGQVCSVSGHLLSAGGAGLQESAVDQPQGSRESSPLKDGPCGNRTSLARPSEFCFLLQLLLAGETFPSGWACSDLLLYLLGIELRRKIHHKNSLATLKGHLSHQILSFHCTRSIQNFSNGYLIILVFGLSSLLCMKHLFWQSSKSFCTH